MPGIGVDISEVINELGVSVTILRTPTNISEKITYELDNSASRAFFREYALNASLIYNTQMVPGDIIHFNGEYYMVAHKTPDVFENEVVEHVAVLYKSNFPSTALLLSYAQTQNPTTFEITQGWTVKKDKPYGLVYRSNFFSLLDSEVSTGRDVGIRVECIMPASYAVALQDRVQLSPSEFYRVQDIERFKFPGLHVLTLVDDERPEYVAP